MAERPAKAAAPPAGKPGGVAQRAGRKPRPQAPFRRTYAALDLGTNNCRLLIARPSADGFVVVDAFSRIVRLGEGLSATGRLSDAAMDRAVAALKICAEKLVRRHVSLVRSVATEACRRADNGRDFAARVHAETGIALEIISAEQEARLAVTGCHAVLEPGDGPALVFDIGGGSTELILLDGAEGPPAVIDWFSAPWGVVSLAESEPHGGGTVEDRLAAYGRMRDVVANAFAPFTARLAEMGATPGRLLGTSGTVTTLASVHLGLASYDRRAIDGLVVPAAAMRDITTRLSEMSIAERAALACIGNERADLVVAGCAILDTIMDIWPAERLSVADRGIREGILRLLMARDGHVW
ncbi:Ppx/GppA phosphatase family protein [Sphingomonas naphthae]|uniref:Ppx/GppA phosphatase family protein n=1 Tax=Sphingomonas naphthae TaxID=1813468 RepID=A0ABY7TMC6_9SPHN|nr:Ppx/GppA phosphatase family protein [Sphingomonas naphthae]WCT74362.1 Ppx/GppA phosphatase family protein [Sphingomonas naphthae]